MQYTFNNKNGYSISYEMISANRFRIIAKDVLFYESLLNGNIVMFDFDGGPIITLDAPVKLKGCSGTVSKIEKIDTGYGTIEVIVHLK